MSPATEHPRKYFTQWLNEYGDMPLYEYILTFTDTPMATWTADQRDLRENCSHSWLLWCEKRRQRGAVR